MSLRDILVHVRPDDSWPEHIDISARLATSFGARLTALYTLPDTTPLKLYLRPDEEKVRKKQLHEQAILAEAEQRFRTGLQRYGIPAEWQVGEGAASDLVALTGRLFDLIVVSQTDPSAYVVGWDVAEEATLSSGKPTLIVPYKGKFVKVGQRIVIAWNGSREAARAVYGALPFIERAEQITVLIGQGRETFPSITRSPKIDIGTYLRRCGATVEEKTFDVLDADAGSRLLDIAKAASADLLVMGAYGRSRFRERILGGATSHVLRAMTLPTLMAH